MIGILSGGLWLLALGLAILVNLYLFCRFIGMMNDVREIKNQKRIMVMLLEEVNKQRKESDRQLSTVVKQLETLNGNFYNYYEMMWKNQKAA